MCVSVCLSVTPSGAFCASRSRSLTPAFDSTGLRHARDPTSPTVQPAEDESGHCNGRVWSLDLLTLSLACAYVTAVQSILADMTTYMPADSDVVGALLALVRIQRTYGLSVGDLASGRIAGHKAVLPLSQQTVFDVAVQCLANGRPGDALQWLDHVNITSNNRSVIPPSSLYQAFARAHAQVVTTV